MRRIYHPYWDWEDWRAGMWRVVSGKERKQLFEKAIAFTGNAELYGSYMRRVIVEWPKACEHNLTERSMNRLAWVGHAATCLAIGAPEDVTREAWAFLTHQQRTDADAQALDSVSQWERMHEGKNRQLPLFMEEEGVRGRNTRRVGCEVGSNVQSAKLQGDLQGNSQKRCIAV